MNLNCLTNCYCYYSFCTYRELNSTPTSIYYPCTCYCCPHCRRRNILKLSKMPTKLKTSNGTAAANKIALKTKNKTIKSKKVPQNGKQGGQNDKRESVLAQNGTTVKSGKATNSYHSLHSSNTSLNTSESFCRYKCACPRLEKTDSIQKLSLNISLPSQQEGSTKGSYSRRSKGLNQAGPELSAESLIKKQSFNRSLHPQPQVKNTRSIKHQLDRMCSCCNKNSAMSGSSPNISRHSFAGTKSHSQLDVIDEVDSDIENNRGRYMPVDDYASLDNFWNTKAEADKQQRLYSYTDNQQPPQVPQESKAKMHKNLEDSCVDFLNIVCDNVMESVQKSIDCKLKEFISQATERFTYLTQTMEEHGAAMQYLLQQQAEKMAEQNKRNLEEFYLRMQALIEAQNQTKSNENSVKTSQFAEVGDVEEEQSIISEQQSDIVSHDERFDSEKHAVKCAGCHCCFKEDNICHPCNSEVMGNASAIEPNNQVRETGGCLYSIENQSSNEKGVVELSNSSADTFPNQEAISTPEFLVPQNSSLPMTLTNLCVTTSGNEINCFCNSSAHNQNWREHKMQPHAGRIINNTCNKKSQLKMNSSIVSDNYDTSGYATEPEDNSEATFVNSGRKKLHKKSFHKYHNNHNDAQDTEDDVSGRSSSQTIKRLSRSSLRSGESSPTRLSRL